MYQSVEKKLVMQVTFLSCIDKARKVSKVVHRKYYGGKFGATHCALFAGYNALYRCVYTNGESPSAVT